MVAYSRRVPLVILCGTFRTHILTEYHIITESKGILQEMRTKLRITSLEVLSQKDRH